MRTIRVVSFTLAAVAAAIGATLTRVSGAIAPHRPKRPWARVLEASLVAGACAAIAVLAAAALGACSARPGRGAGAAGPTPACPPAPPGTPSQR